MLKSGVFRSFSSGFLSVNGADRQMDGWRSLLYTDRRGIELQILTTTVIKVCYMSYSLCRLFSLTLVCLFVS